jgi:hypothetical protein
MQLMKLSGDDFSLARRSGDRAAQLIRITVLTAALTSLFAAGATAQLTALRVEDYATAPMTGSVSGTSNAAYLARVNFMADDPADADRFFVNDLNGPLYILDKSTRQFTTYLNFNGRSLATGLYDRLYTNMGFAGGFITFQFDPDYANNGNFYTVHLEQGTSGSQVPDNTNFPGLNTTGYTATTAVDQPGNNAYQTVLVEWTDTNVANSTFEGTGRELLRMDVRDRIHPMGDIIFNPLAQPDDPDWRVMYVSVGDAGAGELTSPADVRATPQRLDTLTGKILRIIPDLTEHTDTSTVSANGRYRIPGDNPYTSIANSAVRDELWAVGLRNPHRMSWDVNPADANPETNNHLIVNDIGLHTWEEVNILYAGKNYGYSQREGNQSLDASNGVGPIPATDTIPVQVTASVTDGTIVPTYPVIQYGHGLAGQDPVVAGDSISSGFVYRGSKIPQLYGKYLFGDITTGAIFYADFAEMLAADDGDASTLAAIHSLDLLWDNPNDAPNDGEELYGTLTSSDAVRGPMHQIVDAAYHFRGGTDPNLPGGASVTGAFGRADIRIQVGADGELYILSKSDGMIRAITGPEPLPGDYDYDGVVDDGDYETWKAAYGTTVPRFGLWADGNADGVVDAADYTVWRDHVLGAGNGSQAAAPEPAAAVLLVVGALLAGLPIRWRG